MVDDNDHPLEYILLDEKEGARLNIALEMSSANIETEEKRLSYINKLKNMNPPIPNGR